MNPVLSRHLCLIVLLTGATLCCLWPSAARSQTAIIEKALELFESPLTIFLKGKDKAIDEVVLERAAIDDLYKRREGKPVWDTGSPEGRAAVAAFVQSLKDYTAYHGLRADLLPLPAIESYLSKPEEIGAALKIELLVTDSLIKLAKRMTGDGVELSHLYTGWPFEKADRDIVGEITDSIQRAALHDYFTSLAPQDEDYRRLASALQRYRDLKAQGEWPTLAAGKTIKEGESDPRLPALIARLQAEGYVVEPRTEGESETLYTPALKNAVLAYQQQNTLEADGNLGALTVTALNKPIDYRIGQIKANMERKRHMPRTLPPRHIKVNIATTLLRAYDNGQIVYDEPVIVGRRDRKTPFIASAIRSVIFNPSWHVPAKIAREDILPKLRRDPHYLEKLGFVINGSADDPHGTAIDWNQVDKSEFNFRLRQAPGEMNSLGRIKFDFDNGFAVYLHGTPHEELFAKAARHLSSGCVRLKDPETFAAFVLMGNEGEWTAEKAKAEIDKRSTRWLKIANPVPLFILYETVYFPTPDSPPHFAADFYNYDKILLDTLAKAR